LSTLIVGSNFGGWRFGSGFADVSVEKVFSWKSSSLGNKNGSELPNRLSTSFRSASSSSIEI
jgi:hypothetical protein